MVGKLLSNSRKTAFSLLQTLTEVFIDLYNPMPYVPFMQRAPKKRFGCRPISYLLYVQARSQKSAIGGGLLGGLGAEPPAAGGQWGSGGFGAKPPALENFAFFCKNNFILGLF